MEALHVWDNHGGCKSRIDFKLRINTDHFKLILKRYNSHRGRALLRSLSISTSPVIEVVRWYRVCMGHVIWIPQPYKVEHFDKEVQMLKNAPFLLALKTKVFGIFFLKPLLFKDRYRFFHETNSKWPRFSVKKAEPIFLYPFNLKSGLI